MEEKTFFFFKKKRSIALYLKMGGKKGFATMRSGATRKKIDLKNTTKIKWNET